MVKQPQSYTIQELSLAICIMLLLISTVGIIVIIQKSYAKEASYPLVAQMRSSSTNNTLNIQNNDNSTTLTSFFALVYHKTGGFIGVDESITYDSFTKELNYISSRQTVSSKILTDQQERNLTQIFIKNGFFEADNFYPPMASSGAADFFEYTLIATLNGKINAIYWTDVSEDAPRELQDIVNNIEYNSK
jgi:hypothetical protein